MPEDVVKLFEEYTSRLARGEEPDPREYLDRAGADEPKLAALIEEHLTRMPLPEPTEEQVAALAAWLEGEGPLLGARRRRGLRRAAVVGRLVELLGLDQRATGRVADYYHELESGLLDPRRVDRRVFDALSQILSVPVAGVLTWRPPQPEAAGAFFRAVQGAPAAPPTAPEVPRPAPEEWDQVDRLFLGGGSSES